jgi:hypothetical protein
MLRETRGWVFRLEWLPSKLSSLKQSLEEKDMEPTISVVTAMLYSVAYKNAEYGESTIPEADFVPFNLSHLRDFSEESEQPRNPFGGQAQNAPDALPA